MIILCATITYLENDNQVSLITLNLENIDEYQLYQNIIASKKIVSEIIY